MSKIVPLFPLNIIVFPKSKYPLHIFEERYIKMIRKSIEEEKPFAIVPKDSTIGTLVEVCSILMQHDDGKMDISVCGVERVHVQSTAKHHDGYLLAAVESIRDNIDTSAESDYDGIVLQFRTVLIRAGVELDEGYWKDLESAKFKSFKLAEKAGLNLQQQIQLIEMRDEGLRLEYLKMHLDRVWEILNEKELNENIILGDGYLS